MAKYEIGGLVWAEPGEQQSPQLCSVITGFAAGSGALSAVLGQTDGTVSPRDPVTHAGTLLHV